MTNDCKDRDLLTMEPGIFTGGGFDSQQMTAGLDGIISGTTFTSLSANFSAAKVEAGMVVCVYSTVPAEALSYEVVSVDSPTALGVSVLRTERDGEKIAPPAGTELLYYVNTFAPQIAACYASIREKLRRTGEAGGIAAEEFVDSSHLRKAVTLAALSAVFTARASNAAENDANWTKAEFYRREYAGTVAALRLARDIDGDGFAEQTRTLGNVTLRRT